ncbi:MAG: hypothetical protein JWO38_4014 [Gemmataceae bacterium]|nr:hypothetical protein [Gemmataceae bacterium]
MLNRMIVIMIAAALLTPSQVDAYGAAHVGYTHVGPSGVQHYGANAYRGPNGAYGGSHAAAYGASGGAYHAGSGGAYHTGYGGATGGAYGYHYSGGAAGGSYHYAYVR